MALNFNQYAAEGNTFLKQYAKELGLSENPERAGRVLMSILHGLRYIILPKSHCSLLRNFLCF
jgi:uncharacterized protein (DUF2267 family)